MKLWIKLWMNELEYIQCNVYIIQGTTFNIVSLSTVCLSMSMLSPHTLSAQCTPSMFCSFDEHCAITAASLQIFFFEYIPPLVRRQIFPPPEIFLEHLLQAFYGVDAPAVSEIFSVKEWRDLETGGIVQGHWKWRRSIHHIRLYDRRARHSGLYHTDRPTVAQLAEDADDTLVSSVTHSSNHLLHVLLPEHTNHPYHLRSRTHSFKLSAQHDDRLGFNSYRT